MDRRIASISCMAAGVAAVVVGTLLAFGIAVALVVFGVALIVVAVLLGWT